MRDRRGVSLILALFTTVVLLTLSIAFIALAIGEARTSRRAAHTIVAQSAASWGVQLTMNFMGRGGNLVLNAPVGSISPFMVIRADAGGPHSTSTSGGGIDVAVSNPPGATSANARRLTFVNASNPGSSPVVVGEGSEQLRADVFVDVEPVLATYGKNQANPFALTATAQVYNAAGELISSRVVEARIAIADDFTIENAMAWDAQGAGIGTEAMKDKIFIPDVYEFSGSLYVTGAKNDSQPWADTAGKLQFESDTPPDTVNYVGPVRVNKSANVGPSGPIDPSQLEPNFTGGASYDAPYYPFVGENSQNYFNTDRDGDGNLNRSPDTSGYVFGAPNEERGLFFAAAIDSSPSKSGYVGISRTDIETVNQQAPRLPDLSDTRHVALQNYTPVLPEVEVVLRADEQVTVNVWNTNQGDGGINDKSTGLLRSNTLKLEDLEAGTIYVEGANAVVRSALSDDAGFNGTGEFKGQLSVAVGENPQRQPLNQRTNRYDPAQYANYSESIYHDAAAVVFREVQRRCGIDNPVAGEGGAGEGPTIVVNGQVVDNPNFISEEAFVDQQLQPPYTRTRVNQLASQFGLTVDTSGMVDTVANPGGGGSTQAHYWPPPAPGVEREGNLVIGGDVETDDAGSTAVGLYAQNFILLNDRTLFKKADPKTLKVEAALMSFEHSLQLDWDNTGKNRVPDAFNTILAPGFNGTFVLNGLLQSRYSDVEGTTEKQGYYNQKITYNQALKYISTPTEPIFDPSLLSNEQVSIPWQVIQYIDKGSINTLFSS